MPSASHIVTPPLELPEDILQAFDEHRKRSQASADAIIAKFGSAAAYHNSLLLETIDTPSDSLLPDFYDLYAQIFTLADEREPLEGFANVFAYNRDEAVQRDFGPFHEPILVARDQNTGEIVAAASFTLYAYPQMLYSFDASCQLHFLLVREERRGIGIGSYLIGEVEKAIATFALKHCGTTCPRAFITCEQNNPARMTRDEILADARAALIHPHARMDWWRRRGFRRLDFRYVQPPLGPEHAPCTYLDYYARQSSGIPETLPSIPSDVLIEHLRRFFFVSVGKLAFDMNANSQWQAIRLELQRVEAIALI
jgi:GNAT superfamily N-acetyltransferase